MRLSSEIEKLVCSLFLAKHGGLTTGNDFLFPRDAIKAVTKEFKKNLR